MPEMLKIFRDVFEFMRDDTHPNTYTVFDAPDGKAALEMITSQTSDFNVILSDIKMPRMDGITFLKAVRTLKPNIPVILYSAHTSKEQNEKLILELGAFDVFYIPPPDFHFVVWKVDEAGVWNLERLGSNSKAKSPCQNGKDFLI